MTPLWQICELSCAATARRLWQMEVVELQALLAGRVRFYLG